MDVDEDGDGGGGEGDEGDEGRTMTTEEAGLLLAAGMALSALLFSGQLPSLQPSNVRVPPAELDAFKAVVNAALPHLPPGSTVRVQEGVEHAMSAASQSPVPRAIRQRGADTARPVMSVSLRSREGGALVSVEMFLFPTEGSSKSGFPAGTADSGDATLSDLLGALYGAGGGAAGGAGGGARGAREGAPRGAAGEAVAGAIRDATVLAGGGLGRRMRPPASGAFTLPVGRATRPDDEAMAAFQGYVDDEVGPWAAGVAAGLAGRLRGVRFLKTALEVAATLRVQRRGWGATVASLDGSLRRALALVPSNTARYFCGAPRDESMPGASMRVCHRSDEAVVPLVPRAALGAGDLDDPDVLQRRLGGGALARQLNDASLEGSCTPSARSQYQGRVRAMNRAFDPDWVVGDVLPARVGGARASHLSTNVYQSDPPHTLGGGHRTLGEPWKRLSGITTTVGHKVREQVRSALRGPGGVGPTIEGYLDGLAARGDGVRVELRLTAGGASANPAGSLSAALLEGARAALVAALSRSFLTMVRVGEAGPWEARLRVAAARLTEAPVADRVAQQLALALAARAEARAATRAVRPAPLEDHAPALRALLGAAGVFTCWVGGAPFVNYAKLQMICGSNLVPLNDGVRAISLAKAGTEWDAAIAHRSLEGPAGGLRLPEQLAYKPLAGEPPGPALPAQVQPPPRHAPGRKLLVDAAVGLADRRMGVAGGIKVHVMALLCGSYGYLRQMHQSLRCLGEATGLRLVRWGQSELPAALGRAGLMITQVASRADVADMAGRGEAAAGWDLGVAVCRQMANCTLYLREVPWAPGTAGPAGAPERELAHDLEVMLVPRAGLGGVRAAAGAATVVVRDTASPFHLLPVADRSSLRTHELRRFAEGAAGPDRAWFVGPQVADGGGAGTDDPRVTWQLRRPQVGRRGAFAPDAEWGAVHVSVTTRELGDALLAPRTAIALSSTDGALALEFRPRMVPVMSVAPSGAGVDVMRQMALTVSQHARAARDVGVDALNLGADREPRRDPPRRLDAGELARMAYGAHTTGTGDSAGKRHRAFTATGHGMAAFCATFAAFQVPGSRPCRPEDPAAYVDYINAFHVAIGDGAAQVTGALVGDVLTTLARPFDPSRSPAKDLDRVDLRGDIATVTRGPPYIWATVLPDPGHGSDGRVIKLVAEKGGLIVNAGDALLFDIGHLLPRSDERAHVADGGGSGTEAGGGWSGSDSGGGDGGGDGDGDGGGDGGGEWKDETDGLVLLRLVDANTATDRSGR